MTSAQQALQELHRVPLRDFVAERKRLATELRRRGDQAAAAEVARRRKPTASAWAVNQLYRHARAEVDELLALGARLRKGDVRASRAYHDALGELRRRAATVLREGGLGASDAVLRRVSATLGALAAAGGFDPDPPGALAEDRDPPGFEAVTLAPGTGRAPRDARPPRQAHAVEHKAAREAGRAADNERRAAERARETEGRAAERAREAERRRMHAELRAASSDVRTRQRAVEARGERLRHAEQVLRDAQEALRDAERALRDAERALSDARAREGALAAALAELEAGGGGAPARVDRADRSR
jgi:hypothetical protein